MKHLRSVFNAIFVTPHTPLHFAGLNNGSAPHRLHQHAVFIQCLKKNISIGRHLEEGRSIFFNRHGTENSFALKIRPVHSGRLRPLTAPHRLNPVPFFGRFNNAQIFNTSPLHAFHVGADVNILNVEATGCDREVARVGLHIGNRARPDRHGIKAAGRLGVEQNFIAKDIDQIEAHLLPFANPAGHQKLFFAERIRIFITRKNRFERVVVSSRSPLADEIFCRGRPGAYHRSGPVDALTAINDGQRAPWAIMTGTEYTKAQLRARNDARIDHTARRGGIVSPVDRMAGTVGVNRPKPLRIAEVAVDIFPTVVKNPSVRHQRAVSFKERAFTDLMNIRPVGLHTEQVGHNMTITHAELRFTR